MLPLKDYNPTRRIAVITLLLIVVNVGVYFLAQPAGRATFVQNNQQNGSEDRYTVERAAIPSEVVRGRPLTEAEVADAYGGAGVVGLLCRVEVVGPRFRYEPDRACWPHKNVYLSVLVSMFLHGSLLHIAGNMLFLWIFGNNIEDTLGHLKFLGFYLLAGVVATAAFMALNPFSAVPLVGASGAIAGVMGAYLVLFPNVRIRSLLFFVVLDIKAKWWLLVWLASQFVLNQDGVAWTAHVGGFVFGILAGVGARRLYGSQRRLAGPAV